MKLSVALIAVTLTTGPLALAATGATGEAVSSDPALAERLRVEVRTVRHLALNPTLVRAVRRQNRAALTPAQISERDEAWRSSDGMTPLKRELQESPAGRLLQRYVVSGGSFNGAFVTDERGANVAAFPPSSDYFQGDEEKWSASFNQGRGQVFLGPVERDESTRQSAVQVSAPVIDRGKTIGVLVVGVRVDDLDSRKRGAQ